jgi:hypothetical protein
LVLSDVAKALVRSLQQSVSDGLRDALSIFGDDVFVEHNGRKGYDLRQAPHHRNSKVRVIIELGVLKDIDNRVKTTRVAEQVDEVQELAADALENPRHCKDALHARLRLNEVIDFLFQVVVIHVGHTLARLPRHQSRAVDWDPFIEF